MILPFKVFVKETATPIASVLPAIETTGLSSNTDNNNTPNYGAKDIREFSEEGLQNALKEHYWHNSVHKEHLLKLTQGSRTINKKLHSQYLAGNPPKHTQVDGRNTRHIDKALSQHKTPHDMHVYTGTARVPKPGSYQHPAYLHTSINHKFAVGYART